jgi:S-adenosylmethionine:tRNA ribosyltransferase-isomerase
MKIDHFDFILPQERIALEPANPRDSARMLVVNPHAEGSDILDAAMLDLPAMLRPGDAMVFNDTRVIPARVMGKIGSSEIECLLHQPIQQENAKGQTWRAFVKPGKKCAVGSRIEYAGGMEAEIIAREEDGQAQLVFLATKESFFQWLTDHGSMPLPPYIQKHRPADARDVESYQTIFARHDGSVAAPTAGLHYTKRLIEAIQARGVSLHHLTLHVGAGTFLPVRVEDTNDHKMHKEWGQLTAETAHALNQVRANGGRIIAVGTTSLRLLESACSADGRFQAFSGETDIFITPGRPIHSADVLMTNFHLPKSTLFMLVCAFAGMERIKRAYQHAIANHYRFYSYGDSCMLFREDHRYAAV